MPKVVSSSISYQGWVLIGASIIIPLSYLKKLAGLQLSIANALSLLFAMFTTLCMSAYAQLDWHPCGEEAYSTCRGTRSILPPADGSVLIVLSVFIFAFTCHQNAFTALHNELPRPSSGRANSVSSIAISTALVTYLCISLSGYFMFGDAVKSDVLESFPGNGKLIALMRIATSLLVLMGYPMQAHPARRCICSIFASCGAKTFAQSKHAHWIVTTVFLVMSILTALIIDDFGLALALVGATGSTTITFILPGIVYFQIFSKPHWQRYLAFAQCGLGCAIIPFCVTMILISRISRS